MVSGHVAVLHKEAVEALAIRENGFYVDATFGRGGHSRSILNSLGPDGHLLALDCDSEAITYANEFFGDEERFSIAHCNYSEIAQAVEDCPVSAPLDGVLLDLGVSSPQLDQAQRGFSFDRNGPLDMRMDQSRGQPVSEWLAQVSAADLAVVFKEYGEERYSKRIANKVVEIVSQRDVTTTADLAEIIKRAHPRWDKRKHPATRCFQALRIFINSELDNLKIALDASVQLLRPGGRLVVISFHSLEDRIVKHVIRGFDKPPVIPRGLPVEVAAPVVALRKIGPAIKPGEAEVAANPRARSSIMRVAEKVA